MSNMTQEKLGKIMSRVINTCALHPESLEDNAVLVAHYWRLWDGWSDERSLEDNIRYATRSETITRRLREARALGLVKQSPAREAELMEAMKNEQAAPDYFRDMFGDPLKGFPSIRKEPDCE